MIAVRELVTPEELAAVVAALQARPNTSAPLTGYALWRARRIDANRVTTTTVTAQTPPG